MFAVLDLNPALLTTAAIRPIAMPRPGSSLGCIPNKQR